MQFEDILNTNLIDLNLSAKNKLDAIKQLVEMFSKEGRVNDQKSFLEDVLIREHVEPTDMGIGIAIPHGKSEAIRQASIAIGRLDTPILWDENKPDEAPVYAIFLLAVSPQDKGITHLELISKIAALLIEDDFIEILKNEKEEARLLETIKTRIGEL